MDLPGELLILGRPLSELQDALLVAAGFERVEQVPAEPYLVFTDRCWFTRAFLENVRAVARKGGRGRVRLTDSLFVKNNAALLTDAEHPEVAVLEAGQSPQLEGPDLLITLGVKEYPAMNLHPSMQHASQGPIAAGAAMVHGIEHWTHLLRVNLLAMLARGEEYRLEFEQSPFYKKIWSVLSLLWRARGISGEKIAFGLSRMGPKCKIHRTAVVEACELGEGVEVGPFAVLRGSVIGRGTRIEPYAQVNLSYIGENARVGAWGMVNLSVLLPGAFVSRGDGFQMSLFGKDCFIAVGATILDLSFGKTIRVNKDGARIDTGSYFLGACVGHRAKIGNGARISYGQAIPNDAFLVGSGEDLLRSWPVGVVGPARVVNGVATVVGGQG